MSKKIIILLIIALVICLFAIVNIREREIVDYVKFQMYGEPIDSVTGIINNKYFGIEKDGTKSKNTTKGINEAIQYAYKNNMDYVKLETGNYKIQIDSNKRGISVYSNLKIDLNSSYIEVEDNSYTGYRVFYLKNESNVEILNGTLIGDKNTHDYETIESEHQWGYAIHIRGGQNIQIHNLDIYNFTGDGIYIDKYKNETSSNSAREIKIYNNNIHDCRRQGISVIDGNQIEIYNNEIHDISGSSPQAGIDLETNEQDEKIQNIKIYGNKFYNFKRNFAIQLYEGVYNVAIFDNDINATIRINDIKEEVKIYNNNMKNGEVIAYLSDINLEKSNQLNRITVENNQMENYHINVETVEMIEIENNVMKNTDISIKSSNAEILGNDIIINNQLEYVYLFSIKDNDNRNYNIAISKERVTGNYKKLENIQRTSQLTVKRKE